MKQLARRASLVVVLLLVSVGSALSQQQPKSVVVEEGVREDGGSPSKFYVGLVEQATPGISFIYNHLTVGNDRVSVTKWIEYYYAGISQGTVHIFRIERDKPVGPETGRRPILLPLDANGTTLLHVLPPGARPFTVRLKRSSDGVTLAASVVK